MENRNAKWKKFRLKLKTRKQKRKQMKVVSLTKVMITVVLSLTKLKSTVVKAVKAMEKKTIMILKIWKKRSCATRKNCRINLRSYLLKKSSKHSRSRNLLICWIN